MEDFPALYQVSGLHGKFPHASGRWQGWRRLLDQAEQAAVAKAIPARSPVVSASVKPVNFNCTQTYVNVSKVGPCNNIVDEFLIVFFYSSLLTCHQFVPDLENIIICIALVQICHLLFIIYII